MHKKDKTTIWKEYFSIPNLMGYFRLLLAGIYLFICYSANSEKDYYISACIIGISMLTDFFDGKIARHFHMVTDFGKILDPIADKITLGAVVISFLWRYPFTIFVVLVFIIKEAFMAFCGLYFMKKGWKTEGATIYGKICTATIYVISFFLLFFPNLNTKMVTFFFLFEIVIMIITLLTYIKFYYRLAKQLSFKTKK